MNLLDPVSFAVINTIKRIIIIFASIWIFQTPITLKSIIGSSIAIIGTFLYSLAQQQKKTYQIISNSYSSSSNNNNSDDSNDSNNNSQVSIDSKQKEE